MNTKNYVSRGTLLAMALTMAACATTERPVVKGPGGGQVHSIDCGIKGVERCYELAARRCPGGYTQLSHKQSTPETAKTRVGNSLFSAGSYMVYDMIVVECSTEGQRKDLAHAP